MLYCYRSKTFSDFSATDGKVDNHGGTEKRFIKGKTFADRLGTLVFLSEKRPFIFLME